MRRYLILAVAMAICGCNSEELPQTQFKVARSQRFSVEEVGEFYDTSHDGGYRRRYLIRDSKTGVEFLAVSGVGVAKVGDDTAEAVAAAVDVGASIVGK